VQAPSHLSLIVPITVLVSLLYALGQLHRYNEFTAMRAAGVGLFRLTWWIWVISAGLSGLLFYLNGSVIPSSVEQSRMFYENLQFAHQARITGSAEEVGVVNNVAHHNRAKGRIWLVARFSRYSNRAFGVHLSFLDPQGREASRLEAAEGYWDEYTRGWVLMRGRETWFDAASGATRRTIAFDRRELPEVDDDPRRMLLLEKRPKDLSFFELRSILFSPDTSGHPRLPAYAVQYHALLAGAFSCLIVTGLAVPFAVTGVRVNPAVGVTKSLALFSLFYLLSTVGSLLGQQGALPPWAAAWLPNVFMAGLAVWLMVRMR
jgi:lipopolysaccharide export system permease protein